MADATVTLSYDYAGRVVWLVGLTDEAHPMVHDLCTTHGDRLSVPRGWVLRDERPRVTELYPSSDAPHDSSHDSSFPRVASA